MPENESISMTVEAAGPGVIIGLSDEGLGIIRSGENGATHEVLLPPESALSLARAILQRFREPHVN